MSGGGAKVPSAMEEAQAQIALERERAKLQADQSAAAKAAADAERAEKIAKAQSKQQAGYDNAVSYGGQQINARGLDQGLVDQYGVLDLFRSELDRKRQSFAEDDINPLYGESTAFADALAAGTNRYRNDLRNQFNAGAGDVNSIFADTMDDSILDAILGTERGNVEAQINAARERGSLSNVGYNKALEKLAAQSKAARAELEDIGRGVLSGYRTNYSSTADTTRNQIGSAGFDNKFDVGGALSALNNLRSQLSGRLEGDIYRATEGQSFFNPNAILSYGQNLQGFFNPSKQAGVGETSPLLAAFIDPNKKSGTNTLTGAQNNGVF